MRSNWKILLVRFALEPSSRGSRGFIVGGNIPRLIHDLGRALVSRDIRVCSSRHDIRESPFEFLDELVVWLLRISPVKGVSPFSLYAVSGTDTQGTYRLRNILRFCQIQQFVRTRVDLLIKSRAKRETKERESKIKVAWRDNGSAARW